MVSLERSIPGLDRRISASSSLNMPPAGVTPALAGERLRGVMEAVGGGGGGCV